MFGGVHIHKFALKSANQPYLCDRCGQVGFGLSYKCEGDDNCNSYHHKQCENPPSKLKYPFSKKCTLKFHSKTSKKDSLCDVCGKKVKGYHYKCTCFFKSRTVHPHCVSCEPSLAAFNGLTLYLQKGATKTCLHCENKDLSKKVHGWAYVSSCGDYSYHVSCVRNIIHESWRQGFITENCDPFECIKKRFNPDYTDPKKKDQKKKVKDAAHGGKSRNSVGLAGNVATAANVATVGSLFFD